MLNFLIVDIAISNLIKNVFFGIDDIKLSPSYCIYCPSYLLVYLRKIAEWSRKSAQIVCPEIRFFASFAVDLSDNAATILKGRQNSNCCWQSSQSETNCLFLIGCDLSNSCYFAYFSIWLRHYRKGLLGIIR